MVPLRDTDDEWLLTSGDAAAFDVFYRRHVEWLLGYLMRATRDPHSAADICAEVFATALVKRRSYRQGHGADAAAWLLTIAPNKALARPRARARRPVPVDEVDAGSSSPAEPRDGGLWRAVDALPPKQRGAVLLRFVGDLSHREIATALGSSEEAARRALADGLAKLRKEWQPA